MALSVPTINILLLGESGIGKSTFINSMANYFHFHKLSEAEKAPEIQVLIPCKVSVTDADNKVKTFSLGHDDTNETLQVGEAATQDVKTYIFPINNGSTHVRLIDSPGMGDRRGIKQDELNCEYILSYLAHIDQLHAICFLMNPKNTRISAVFEYCMKQILSRLEKSAVDNIIFLFTNTRASNYQPSGETMACLRKVIDDIRAKPPHAAIPITSNNVFSVDNEGFRYLVALRNQHSVSINEQKVCAESWKKSRDECYRLIAYIVGDDNNPGLVPHQIQNTTSINEARRLIFQLSKPMSDLAQLVDDNLRALDNAKRDLQKDNQSVDDLKKKLFVPIVDLEVIQLNQPTTVCATKKCSEIYTVNGVSKWNYKQRCHEPCFLRNVGAEVIGDPALIHCAAMCGKQSCQRCGCDYTQHMHVYYMTKTVNKNTVDTNINSTIKTKEQAIAQAKKIIDEINVKKDEFIQEKEILTRSAADFAFFLQNHAISPYNDAYKAYIEYLIETEKALGSSADKVQIQSLQELLRRHDELIATFQRSLQMNQGQSPISAQQILKNIDQIKHLKHCGKKIQEILQSQNTTRKKEYNDSYVHAKSVQVTEKINKKKASGISNLKFF